ncbi:MAG: GNAT family N-acetyltransferase [Burkholderiaceae bacterium]|jgi:acetyltransferase|nr:GNAT family N-acetyltransferase [Burkholderiaceae bacterium]
MDAVAGAMREGAANPAREALAAGAPTRYSIARYPTTLIDRLSLADGRVVTIRPVLPQDAELAQRFVAGLSLETRYRRFQMGVGMLPPRLLRHLTEIDYAAHLALLAGVVDESGDEIQVADARYVVDADAVPWPDGEGDADFALVVADGWQGVGLGSELMRRMARAARSRGLARLHGEVLSTNMPMLDLLRRFGARLRTRAGDARIVDAWIELRGAAG